MERFDRLVRRSVQKDFDGANFKRMGYAIKKPHPKDTRRVLAIHQGCEYYQFRKFFVGKLVRVLEDVKTQVWVEFVNEKDRTNLNNAAGWSNGKRKYLLKLPKFDD